MSFSPAYGEDIDSIEEVITTGTIQTDPAMSAWRSGDFETAEIEFRQNAFCALRIERNFISGVEGARDSTIRSDVGTDIDVPSQPSGGLGGAVVAPTSQPVIPKIQLNSSDFRDSDNEGTRTCEDRGFQIYMMGMSQLKLGKRDEAKATLLRSTKLRKNLYDAHFRLSLLEYQDNNMKEANKHFKKLRKIGSKCKKCEAKKEIIAQIKYLENPSCLKKI
jgi:tetratricopeptide (TPR) repeat protein